MPERRHTGIFDGSRRFRRVDGSPHGHIRAIGRAGVTRNSGRRT